MVDYMSGDRVVHKHGGLHVFCLETQWNINSVDYMSEDTVDYMSEDTVEHKHGGLHVRRHGGI